jgi:hypothetical protein
MPEMPAFCDNCGTVFGSGFVFENCRNVTLSGNQVGPCPNCGGMGHVPDGVYDITGNAIRLLQGSIKTVQQLQQLSAVLFEAQKQNLSKEQVQANIQETLPELHDFASVLPQTRSELYGFIGIILTAIGLMIAAYGTFKDDTLPEREIEQIIERSIEQSIQKLAPLKPPVHKKQKRNDPCACGSGFKYKKCCYLTA